jgi:hypothetical protein
MHEDQLARTEAIYTSGFEYEQSYYIVGAMTLPRGSYGGRQGNNMLPDFGFSLQLNHEAMQKETNYLGKRTKKLFNFVPIKFLFVAFGCLTDREMLH